MQLLASSCVGVGRSFAVNMPTMTVQYVTVTIHTLRFGWADVTDVRLTVLSTSLRAFIALQRFGLLTLRRGGRTACVDIITLGSDAGRSMHCPGPYTISDTD